MSPRQPPYRVVFMGCPDFAVPSLNALHQDPAFEVVAVYCMPDRPKGRGHKQTMTPVKAQALALGYPVQSPPSFRRDPEAVAQLRAYRPDFCVVVAYGLILAEEILQIPAIAAVNLHASLLPRYSGPAPIHFSLINGDATTGNTVMLMSKGMDEGDILAAQELPIHADDTIATLHDRLRDAGAPLLIDTLKALAEGNIRPVPQNHAEATYTTKIERALAELDWRKDANTLERLIRAMTPCPGAWFRLGTDRYKVGSARPGPVTDSAPGEVLAVSPAAGIRVACGARTTLDLLSLQRPGKGMLPVADFLRGCDFSATRLPLPDVDSVGGS